MARRPTVTTRCVADHYAARIERIIEFQHGEQGGLITFVPLPDGRLKVNPYQLDPGVVIVADPRNINWVGCLPYGWENQ